MNSEIKTIEDLIEKLKTYPPEMLVGSSYSNSWGDWFCELILEEEFIEKTDKREPAIYPYASEKYTRKVLVIY